MMRLLLAVAALASPLLAGCPPAKDDRLVEHVHTMQQLQAKHQEELVQQSSALAKASQSLVEADAQARQELLRAQAELHSAVQQEQARLDQQRSRIDDERRALSRWERADPMIAAAIHSAAAILACLAPLVLAGYAIYAAQRQEPGSEAVCDLVIEDLLSDRSMLLTGQATPRQLPHDPAPPQIEAPTVDGNEPTAE
jgi:outer membrane murein-binding lipoprotein Lpp